MTVAAYYIKLKKLWDELGSYNDTICSCGADHKRRRLMQFLMGLNESYNAIRGQILLIHPLPDVTKAYSLIMQEEKQRSLGTIRETIENSAMVIQRAEPVALAVRHGQSSSSRPNSSHRKPLHCSYCDCDHHVRETCWKLNGYPPGHPKHASNKSNQRKTHFKSNNNHQSSVNNVKTDPTIQEVSSVTNGLPDVQMQQILSILQVKRTTSSIDSQANVADASSGLLQKLLRLHQLITDSGATDHITSSPILLINNNKNTVLPPVVMPSREQAPITSIGDLPLNSAITLKNVLGVPSFTMDLMSVSCVTRDLIHPAANGLPDVQMQQILSILQVKRTTSSIDSQANVADASSGLLQKLLRLHQLITDSGATDHITSSPILLINNNKNTVLPPVVMPSREQAPITSIGDLPLNSAITLKNVLGVPSFTMDLMSVSCVTRDLIHPAANGLPDVQMQQILSILQVKRTTSSIDSQANVADASSGLLQKLLRLHQLITDSGATDHITSSPILLINNNKNTVLPPVVMPSREQAPITSIGDLPLNSAITLKNVLGVPSFTMDLMSVSCVTRDLNCSVTFFPQWCILQNLMTRTMIGLGKQRDGLYYLVALASEKPKPPNPSTAAISCRSPSSQVPFFTTLWHRRLGHLSSSRLFFMAKHLLNFPFQSHKACDVCALAKQSRLPFSVSSISSVQPFELIHCDIWGPYKIASLSGAKYFLTIVDDYSRFTWVFFMHHKSETQHLLTNFFHLSKHNSMFL
ncbi:RNA-directed DNA polymerase protein [Dioscorea alata]|uniref:RNA-directed DNA polymerase protein n=1 Tax=Dioscorea alata TaxID=55571 RepID=A0ACB7WVH0_DIOAL|nr:RNA-directed DNA polymerase protein [Dioscorea alata]